jgi:phosphate transport system substrate-binding protein
MKSIHLFFILGVVLMYGCGNKNISPNEQASTSGNTGKIKIIGAFALSPLVERWAAEYRKSNPSVSFEITSIGSGDAANKILSGEADLTMISSELPENIDTMVWEVPVAKLSVVVIANRKNPYYQKILETGITRDNLAELFTGAKTCWGDFFGVKGKNPVNIYLRSDHSGATDNLTKYLWIEKNDLKGTSINGETQLIETIKKDQFALGYCNFIYSFDPATKLFDKDIFILPLDINQNCQVDKKENFYGSFKELQRAIWLGKYPCVLNRPLQLAAAKKPTKKEVLDFLKWIYTDGQKFIPEMGYMELRTNEVKYCIAYVNE